MHPFQSVSQKRWNKKRGECFSKVRRSFFKDRPEVDYGDLWTIFTNLVQDGHRTIRTTKLHPSYHVHYVTRPASPRHIGLDIGFQWILRKRRYSNHIRNLRINLKSSGISATGQRRASICKNRPRRHVWIPGATEITFEIFLSRLISVDRKMGCRSSSNSLSRLSLSNV